MSRAAGLLAQVMDWNWETVPSAGIPSSLEAAQQILDELYREHGYALVKVPEVQYLGGRTNAQAMRDGAKRLDGNYPVGGSNTRAAVAEILRSAADELEALS